MKSFSIHWVRNVFAVVIALGLGYVAYTVNPTLVTGPKVEAGASQNVSGWVWSEGTGTTATGDNPTGPYSTVAGSNPGVGWVSLNSSDCDTDKNGYTDSGACGGNNTSTVAQNYGVNISPLTGIGSFSGQAWSPNEPDINGNPTGQGWISFDRGITGSPDSALGDPGASQTGAPLAYVDWTTGKVYGWARAIVACKDTKWDGAKCTSYLFGDRSGGWDGWVKLSDASWTTGVKIDLVTGNFSGYAWGGDVMGWLIFAPNINGTPLSPSYQATVSGVNATCPTGTYGDPGYTWGTCNPTGTCTVANAGKVLSGQAGTSIGVCSNGVAASPVVCNTATLDCTGATPPKPKYYQF